MNKTIPEQAILARVVHFEQLPHCPRREIQVHLWFADAKPRGDGCCFLHIDVLQERPLPVAGIDNMNALENALALVDALLGSSAPAGAVTNPAGGPYLSTAGGFRALAMSKASQAPARGSEGLPPDQSG